MCMLSRLINKTNKTDEAFMHCGFRNFHTCNTPDTQRGTRIQNFKSRTPLSTSLPPPYTFLAKAISTCHENAVKRDEQTNPLVCSESNCRILHCQDQGKIPHEASLVVGHQTCSDSISVTKQCQSVVDRSK